MDAKTEQRIRNKFWNSVPPICHYCGEFNRIWPLMSKFKTFDCSPERLMKVQMTGKRCPGE